MNNYVVIPARLDSTRLPRKVLADIEGLPMVVRTYRQAESARAGEVLVATDSQEVSQVCEQHGVNVVMTSGEHSSGTSRIEEVTRLMDWDSSSCVINVQADEPLIAPSLIQQVAEGLQQNTWADVATLCKPLDAENAQNPNRVKVALGEKGRAVYFSRSMIPHHTEAAVASGVFYQHIGIYAYRVGLLRDFVAWAPSELEQIERLEQLRVLANGAAIHVAIASADPGPGIDSPEDLQAIREKFL